MKIIIKLDVKTAILNITTNLGKSAAWLVENYIKINMIGSLINVFMISSFFQGINCNILEKNNQVFYDEIYTQWKSKFTCTL